MADLRSLRREIAQIPSIIDRQTAYELALNKLEPVVLDSTCVGSFDWEPDEYDPVYGTLTIEFVGPPYGGAGTYEYYDFPISEWALFQRANSKGEYFNSYIRNHGYSYERVG